MQHQAKAGSGKVRSNGADEAAPRLMAMKGQDSRNR
jgi:hypothetical protein